MANITKNFTMEELIASTTAKQLKIDNTPTESVKKSLVQMATLILQPLRDAYGKPIKISSGYRCPKLNVAVKGSKSSQHLKGEAVDLNIGVEENKKLFNLAKQLMRDGKIKVGQLIDEKNYSWIHISLPTPKHNNEVLHL